MAHPDGARNIEKFISIFRLIVSEVTSSACRERNDSNWYSSDEDQEKSESDAELF